MPKVSIIIPMFNVESYIEKCIESVKNQTFSDFEAIIIDDGSFDASYSIAQSNIANDVRFRIIQQPNSGLSSARNTGIINSSADYLVFIDSDDEIESIMIESLFARLTDDNSDLAVCNLEQFDRNRVYQSSRYADGVVIRENSNFINYFAHCIDSCCNKLYRRSIIEMNNIRFESKEFIPQEDFYFLFKYLFHSRYISTLKVSGYKYRMRKNSITKTTLRENHLHLSMNLPIAMIDYSCLDKSPYIQKFACYAALKMLFSAIHQPGNVNSKQIYRIVKEAQSYPLFIMSLKFISIFNYSKREKYILYNVAILILLKLKFIRIASKIEFFRVKRLFSHTNQSNYFD